jgi:hypothetical protein
VDKNPFLVNTIDLQNSKVLIWPEQAEAAKCKNVVIGEKRTITANEKILSREVVVEKTVNGKESLKITIKALTLGGGAGPSQDCRGDDKATWSSATSQTGSHYRSDWFS